MEKFLFLVLMLMLISRLFHAGSHTIILMLMLVLIAQVVTRLKPPGPRGSTDTRHTNKQ